MSEMLSVAWTYLKHYLRAIELCEELTTVVEHSLDADKTNYKAAGIETILTQLRQCQSLFGYKTDTPEQQ